MVSILNYNRTISKSRSIVNCSQVVVKVVVVIIFEKDVPGLSCLYESTWGG